MLKQYMARNNVSYIEKEVFSKVNDEVSLYSIFGRKMMNSLVFR